VEALECQRAGFWTDIKTSFVQGPPADQDYEAKLAQAMTHGGPFSPYTTEASQNRHGRLDLTQHYLVPYFDLSKHPTEAIEEVGQSLIRQPQEYISLTTALGANPGVPGYHA